MKKKININSYIKNVKYYADVNTSDMEDVLCLFNEYNTVKNYCYKRYSGIKSIHKINSPRKYIRKDWYETKLIQTWSLNTNYISSVIDDASSNLKSNLSNHINRIQSEFKKIYKTDKYNAEQKHYINYTVLYKLEQCLNQNICCHATYKGLDYNTLNNAIRRVYRIVKSEIPRTESKTIIVDKNLYNIKNDYLYLSSLIPNKRFAFKINALNPNIKGTIHLTLNERTKRITISRALECKVKSLNGTNEIGIDKNYINCFETSSGNSYGLGFKTVINEYSDYCEKQKAIKNFYKSKCKNKPNLEDTIKQNNLGVIRYNRKKRKLQERKKQFINRAINELIQHEKPKKIIVEKLDIRGNKSFKSAKNKTYSKKTKTYLSYWDRGYIQERLEFKTKQHGIELKEINPAWTSQICFECGCFGSKVKDEFHCTSCGKVEQHGINAAKNIKARELDLEINLRTNVFDVKSILLKRLSDKKADIGVPLARTKRKNKPSQPYADAYVP